MKRMSNGEAKPMTSSSHSTSASTLNSATQSQKIEAPTSMTVPLGPHPSTIRVSAPYLSQASIDKRLVQSITTNCDAHEKSLAEAREDNVRLQGVIWLDTVRRALQLPIKTYTTACVYYHKFRLAHPNIEYNWADAAAASLLTSCKNEDTLKKSRDILAAAYNVKQINAHEHVGSDDPILDNPSRIAIGLERLVLESGAFDFRSRSPHHMLIKIGKALRTQNEDETHQTTALAWTVLSDIHRTWAPLKQTSATLALASLELAAELQAVTSECGNPAVHNDLQYLDLQQWHTTRQEIMETLLDALDLYTHHTQLTVLGTQFSLDDFLRIRLALNRECSAKNIDRYANLVQPASPVNANGSERTLRVSNGHPTPISPPLPDDILQPRQSANTTLFHPVPDGGGTLRFMLNPRRAANEKLEVNRYHVEEWEEYEEEVEVPLPSRLRSRERKGERDIGLERMYRDRDTSARLAPSQREFDRSVARDERERGRQRLKEREREVERDRDRLRERERERDGDIEWRYEHRRYDGRGTSRYDERRERERERRYYDEDLRRRPSRDERR